MTNPSVTVRDTALLEALLGRPASEADSTALQTIVDYRRELVVAIAVELDETRRKLAAEQVAHSKLRTALKDGCKTLTSLIT